MVIKYCYQHLSGTTVIYCYDHFILYNMSTFIIIIIFNFRYKNSVPVGNTSRTRIIQNDDICILRFTELYANDAGEIKCDISNSLGKDSCSSNFKVQGMCSCTVLPLLQGHSFCTDKMTLLEGWLLFRGTI